jgi:hypothetical protein
VAHRLRREAAEDSIVRRVEYGAWKVVGAIGLTLNGIYVLLAYIAAFAVVFGLF